jgi:Ca2+-binding RTX toxin-like protein
MAHHIAFLPVAFLRNFTISLFSKPLWAAPYILKSTTLATYAFETITAQEALNILATDTITFAGGAASGARVFYSPLNLTLPARIDITWGGRTVTFNSELSEISFRGQLRFPDSSRLYVGDGGNERASGGATSDAFFGGIGHDSLDGGAGDDFIQGNGGDDVLSGDLGSNTIHGGQGNDTIFAASDGGRGSWAHGNMGDDEVFGASGSDTLLGGQGNDLLGGLNGADYLSGDLGNDELFGGEGNDTLIGGAGDDRLFSGGGADLL